jgi:hypothetical protein
MAILADPIALDLDTSSTAAIAAFIGCLADLTADDR